jgi:hypothetical protein
MAFKLEYPYIKYLSLQEKADYQSDLPENIDDLEVFHIKTTDLFNNNSFNPLKHQCYWKPEEMEKVNKFDSTVLWITLLYFAFGWSLAGYQKMYWANPVKNFSEFSAEKWPGYLRRRLSLIGITGVALAHYFVFDQRFSNYPKIIG